MQRATASPHSSSLPQIICDWHPSKLSQLTTELSESCSKPQTSFSAYHSYKAYFEPLLLAEISAELSSALDKYQRTTLRQPKVRARREEVGTTLAVVSVQKVTRVHTHGFGWAVDLDSHDRRGPVGCVDNDVVAIWTSSRNQNSKKNVQNKRRSPNDRKIPPTAVLAVVIRSTTRTGCRVVLSNFPDGNENGVRVDLEDGEQHEEDPPKVRVWNLLRVGSLTTMRREFQALQTIKNSVLIQKLLRPNLRTIERDSAESSVDASSKNVPEDAAGLHRREFHSEYFFTDIIANKTHLNSSQARAIIQASTCRDGFAVIQGPPGTGKTKTLIGLLNVIHMVQYQKYYESILVAMDQSGGNGRDQEMQKVGTTQKEEKAESKDKGTGGSLLQSMMVAMNKTASSSAAASENRGIPLTRRGKRPRLLICAPSNSAVDEILTRLMKSKLLDGRGNSYCPELARIGAGDRVSEAAKSLTAEGQAEAFLDEVCAENSKREEQKKAQMAFLAKWQQKCNALLVQLERTPKDRTPSSQAAVIELHEKLERMERDLRRLGIAASDGKKVLSRDEKLRQIARTYVEDAQLVFATLSGSASSILTKQAASEPGDAGGALFDTVIIDEAAQATETSSIIPMALGASRCILVGDPQQLPATVLSSGAASLAYGQSLLERVVRAGQGILLLDTQYRMHPAISSFPRRYFYNGRLVDDDSVQGENRSRPFHRDEIKPKLGPYVFLDISEGEERRSGDDRSIFNPAEAELASLIYMKLKKDYGTEPLFSPAAKAYGSTIGFGVVTPYKRQMQELRQSFDRAGVPTGDVEIDTVDSYQGREKDVIVFSCVRTAALHRGIGFVRDVRRMNVGLTRARASLIILGSAQALAEGSADWAELVEDATSRGCLITVTSVARCLTPASAPSIPSKHAVARPTLQAAPPSQAAASIEANQSSVKSHAKKAEERPQNSHRVDPRTKTLRQTSTMSDAVAGSHSHAGQIESIRTLAPGILEHRQPYNPVSTSINASNSALSTEEQAAVPNNTIPHGDANTALQAVLQQMSTLFSEAGFKNTKAVEDTLREHLQSGGELDVETVMAAAIAHTGLPPPAPNSSTAPSYAEGTVDEPRPDTKDYSEPKSFARTNQESHNTETTDADQSAKHGREIVTESKHAQTKPSSEKQKKPKKVKPEKSEAKPLKGEPSGWDMLFDRSKAPGSKTDTSAEKKPKTEQASERPDKTHGSGIQEEKKTEIDKTQTSLSSTRKEVTKASDTHEVPQTERNVNMPRVTGKKRWNGQSELHDKRRDRGSDFRGGRGSGRGRHHSKRPRGPRHEQMDQSLSGSAGFGNETPWAQQLPYDPNMAAYQMMQPVVDPALGGNPQAMVPMQAMQQQAMQQQIMQQQVLQQQQQQQQQQAVHPHVFLQQLQQQAMQQEALRQQALIMQMSAAGMQHAGMANPYGVVDFDGFNGGGGLESRPQSQGGSEWGHGQNTNTYTRRGRGRGRGRQKGGRGRGY